VAHACASVAAAFFSCTFSAPADIVMTRYQAGPLLGRPYASPLECVRTMVAEEGAMVFFRGCAPVPPAPPRPLFTYFTRPLQPRDRPAPRPRRSRARPVS
jgi:hypothetical protein